MDSAVELELPLRVLGGHEEVVGGGGGGGDSFQEPKSALNNS